MPTEVQLPDGVIAEFPDEMSDDDIRSVLRSRFSPGPQSPQVLEPPSTLRTPIISEPPSTLRKPIIQSPFTEQEFALADPEYGGVLSRMTTEAQPYEVMQRGIPSALGITPSIIPSGREIAESPLGIVGGVAAKPIATVASSVAKTGIGIADYLSSRQGTAELIGSMSPARVLVMAKWAKDMAQGAGEHAGLLVELIRKKNKTPEDWQAISDNTVNTIAMVLGSGTTAFKAKAEVGKLAKDLNMPEGKFQVEDRGDVAQEIFNRDVAQRQVDAGSPFALSAPPAETVSMGVRTQPPLTEAFDPSVPTFEPSGLRLSPKTELASVETQAAQPASPPIATELTAIDIAKMSPDKFVEYVKGKDQLAEQRRIAQSESSETIRAMAAQALDATEAAKKSVDLENIETLQPYADAAAKMQFFNEVLREKIELGKGEKLSEKAKEEVPITEPAKADPIEQWFDDAIKKVEFGTDWTGKTSMGVAKIPVWLTQEAAAIALRTAKFAYTIGRDSFAAIRAGIDAIRRTKGFNEAEATEWLKSQFDSEPSGSLKMATSPEAASRGEATPPTIPTPRTTTDPITGEPAKLVTEKAARAMESKVKIPAQADVTKISEQIELFNREIGEALETGGQFLPKELRPDVAKGAPAERGTVTNRDINQYFVNKLSSIRKQMQAARNRIAQTADVESQVYFDTLQKRFETAFRQVQELRRASHEALYFWNRIRAEYQDIARAAGEMPEMKKQIPILDQIWKDFREGKPGQAGRHAVDYLRMNLFTAGSWTLDFGTNLVASATKLPAWAIMDMASLVTGNAPTKMFSAIRALQNGMRNWNPLGKRYRLPDAIESELGTTAGGEFGGKGREVLVDFSEILRDRPELADKLRHIDKVIGAPIRMKRAVDSFFGRFGAAAELYSHAYKEGRGRGLRGDELKTFVEEFVQNPSEPALNAALKTGKELKFNRDLTKFEEAFSSNVITKLVVEAFPRWTFQFIRWGGEMLGVDPSFFKKVATGKATPEEAVHYLTKAATGWGGVYAFNQLFYDNIDANSMEYVKEDGNRVRLAGRTPAPELFFINALLRGDTEKAKAALQHLSVPGAKLLSGEPAGILSPLIDTIRESIKGRYTAEMTVRELTKLINDAIPGKSVLGLIRSIYDPTVREGVGAPIPGVASTLPQRINPTTGEPLAPKTRIPGTSIELPTVGGTPFPGAERVLNDIESSLLDHGLGLTRPRRTSIIDIPAEDVPKEVRREYEKLVGDNVKQFVGDVIKTEEFKSLPFEVRRDVLSELLTVSRTVARGEIAQKYGTGMAPVKSDPLNVQRLPERLRK